MPLLYQAGSIYATLIIESAGEPIVVAHSTVSNGNRRRLGNALFAAANTVYHFRSDHRYREDVRQFRCVQSRWRMPEVMDLQRDLESGGYEVMREAARQASQTPSILELVEFIDEKRWAEANHITQHFEDRATVSQVAKLIREAHLLGWIFRRHINMPWQLDERGEAYIAAKKAQAEEVEKKRANAVASGADLECSDQGSVNCQFASSEERDHQVAALVSGMPAQATQTDSLRYPSDAENFSADTEISIKN